jgi:hypothetical protein
MQEMTLEELVEHFRKHSGANNTLIDMKQLEKVYKDSIELNLLWEYLGGRDGTLAEHFKVWVDTKGPHT